MPDNGPRIGDAVRTVGDGRVEVVDAADLEAAVVAAVDWATPGGVVLLSPAAPSFGRFGDYRERSAAFAAAAARYGPLS
jgi:UDP-N-acetylmuramoylalanine--D-glutamate ligase